MVIEKVISNITIDLEQDKKQIFNQNQTEQNNYDKKDQFIDFDDLEKMN